MLLSLLVLLHHHHLLLLLHLHLLLLLLHHHGLVLVRRHHLLRHTLIVNHARWLHRRNRLPGHYWHHGLRIDGVLGLDHHQLLLPLHHLLLRVHLLLLHRVSVVLHCLRLVLGLIGSLSRLRCHAVRLQGLHAVLA